MLDIKINTFLKVAQIKNYTKAAKELNLTQPAVTHHIRKLEEYYGCKLVDINGKSVNLTAAGNTLYHYANLQTANEKQLVNRIDSIAAPLNIGATLSIADYYLPLYLCTYMTSYNDLFSVTVKNTTSLINMLLNNELDCAFIEGIFDKSLFKYHEFCITGFLPVARKGHPLEGKVSSLSNIHEFPLILREKGSGTREILENHLYQNNDSILSFSKIFEVSSFFLIKKLLNNSNALSFMYEEVAAQEVNRGELCFLSLENYSIKRPLYFIYPHNSLMKDRYEMFYNSLNFN